MNRHMAGYEGLPPLSQGSTHLVEMRQAGELYVDKTGEIHRLLEDSARHVFVARPRRFGKSLMLSTIEGMYQGHLPQVQTVAGAPWSGSQSVKLDDRELFAGTFWTDRSPSDNPRPVIRLDLGNAIESQPEALRRALADEVLEQGCVWRERGFEPGISLRHLLDPGNCQVGPGSLLRQLIRALKNRFDKTPVILVDEFDAPLTALNSRDSGTEQALDVLRGFFNFIKSGRQNLHKAILTGVTRNAYAHPLSALNLVFDMTWDARFGALCGFTETDLDAADGLGAYVERAATALGMSMEALRDRLRDYYNGYRFDLEGTSEPVYNPWSLTRTLIDLGTEAGRHRFKQGQFPKYWVLSGSMKPLIAWLERTPRESVDTLKAEGALDYSPIEDSDPRLYLLQSGYLTVKPGLDGTPPFAAFPNREVAEAFIGNLTRLDAAPAALAMAHASDDRNPIFLRLRQIMHRQAYDNLPLELETLLSNFAGARLNTHDTCLNVLQAVFAALGGLDVRAEPKEAGGWPDLVVRHPEHACAIELKFNQRLTDARHQADARDYGRALLADYVHNAQVTVLALHIINQPGRGLRVEGARRPLLDGPDHWRDLKPGIRST